MKLTTVGSLAIALCAMTTEGCACPHTVDPGTRGVRVNTGTVDKESLPPGLYFPPAWTTIHEVNTRQQKADLEAPCFSSDLQEVNIHVAVLFRIPEENVVSIFTSYHGEPFALLVAPRVQESVKEATATRSAEQIVKQREQVKSEALEAIRKKVGNTLIIEDLVIAEIGLTSGLKTAIEAKMVQEQTAAKSKYAQEQIRIEAESARIRAQGEADAKLTAAKAEAEGIRVRGQALRENPAVIELEMIEKWDGVSPQIVGGGTGGMSLMLPGIKGAK